MAGRSCDRARHESLELLARVIELVGFVAELPGLPRSANLCRRQSILKHQHAVLRQHPQLIHNLRKPCAFNPNRISYCMRQKAVSHKIAGILTSALQVIHIHFHTKNWQH